MKFMKACALAATVAASFAMAVPASAQQQLSIATGGTGGIYYPLGGGLADLIGKHIDGYSAVSEVTGGSVENVALLHAGDSDLAIALGDTVYQAYTGTGQFEGRQIDSLRGMATLYANTVQIVVGADSGIESLQDLKGKRVSVGAPGSGTELNARAVLEANGISYDDLADTQRLNFNETADAIRDGDIDAGVWSVGAPTSSIMNLAVSRDIRLLSLSDEEIANAQKTEPIFTEVTLPADVYDGVSEPTTTIGIPSVLVTTTDMPAELIHDVTKLLYDRIDDMIAVHPAAKDTTVELSLSATPIPMHEGALQYYEEIGAEIPDRLRP